MGASNSLSRADCSGKPYVLRAPVFLQIYNVGETPGMHHCNQVLRPFGTGCFHCGVEFHEQEYSFEGRGIFACHPKLCQGHRHIETVPMGYTNVTSIQQDHLIAMLKKEWPGNSYDLLEKNCTHFCDQYCQWLGVGRLPKWVMSLAGFGASVVNAHTSLKASCCNNGNNLMCLPLEVSNKTGSGFFCGPCAFKQDAPRIIGEKEVVRPAFVPTKPAAGDDNCYSCYATYDEDDDPQEPHVPHDAPLDRRRNPDGSWNMFSGHHVDSRQVMLDPLEKDGAFA